MLGHGSIGDLSSLTAYTSDDDDDLPQSEANSRFDLKDHGLLTKASAPSISTLHRWLHDHGVQASPKTAITAIEGAGWGMRASSNLYEHDIICRIPKTSILSHRTSSLRIPDDKKYAQLSNRPTWFLSLCLLHELRLEEQSDFWGYIQSLPRKPPRIPTTWDREELTDEDGRTASVFLAGTECHRILRDDDRDGRGITALRAFYHDFGHLLPTTPSHQEPSPFSAFIHAFSLVRTRAFAIDVYHTVALCPFADILNHSSSPHTSLSSDDFVCHVCGSLRMCQHDIINSQGISKRLEHLSDLSRRNIENEDDTVDLLVEVDRIQAGSEVFNSYGRDLSAGQILYEWGYFDARECLPYGRLFLDPEEVNGPNHLAKDEVNNGRLLQLNTTEWTQAYSGASSSLVDASLDDDVNDTLSVSCATGQITVALWISLYRYGHPDGTVSDIRRSLAELVAWDKAKAVNDPVLMDSLVDHNMLWMSENTMDTVKAVCDLLRSRLDQILPKQTVLPPNPGDLIRMAHAYALHERCILESILRIWQELSALFDRQDSQA